LTGTSADRASQRPTPRRIFAWLAILLGGLGAFGALEILIRVTELDDAELHVTMGRGTSAFARFDSEKGWVNLAGRNGNNRQGFRFPRDYTRESAARHRIVLLGDSQVWGTGVEANEIAGVQLDERIAEAEVYAFGVPGYGPVQELLVLRDVLRDYDVDEVAAVAFVYNDLVNESVSIDYGGLQKPYLRKTANGWIVENVPVPRPVLASVNDSRIDFFARESEMDFLIANEGLARYSALYRTLVEQSSRQRWLANALAKLRLLEIITETATVNEQYSIRRIDGRDVPCWHLEHCPEEHWLDGLDAVTAAYVEMDRLCREHQVEFYVILTPSYMELENGHTKVIDGLADSLRNAGIRMVDVRGPFRSEADWRNVMGPTRHWTVLGHRMVVDALESDWRDRYDPVEEAIASE